jgi:hypothetical protein
MLFAIPAKIYLIGGDKKPKSICRCQPTSSGLRGHVVLSLFLGLKIALDQRHTIPGRIELIDSGDRKLQSIFRYRSRQQGSIRKEILRQSGRLIAHVHPAMQSLIGSN